MGKFPEGYRALRLKGKYAKAADEGFQESRMRYVASRIMWRPACKPR
jgi:hypothetical protein